MSETIEGAADCEIRSVIRFLKARNVLPSEIHHQTFQVYGDNAMSDGMKQLISGFHLAFLHSITFIVRIMHSIT